MSQKESFSFFEKHKGKIVSGALLVILATSFALKDSATETVAKVVNKTTETIAKIFDQEALINATK